MGDIAGPVRIAAPLLTALVFVLVSMPFFRSLAFKYRLVDFPSKRKMHKIATPLIGGVAIYFGFIIGMSLVAPLRNDVLAILTGSTIILVLGLFDDMMGLSARFRVIVQLVASFIVITFGARIEILPSGFIGDAAEVIISLVWLVGITNAYNYLDGLDGLAAGSAAINLACFGAILLVTGQSSLLYMTAILAAACIGFLPYNFAAGKKKIFLGDAGSTFVGFVLASIGLCGYWAEGDPVRIVIPILILGVPIFDMTFTTVMRIAERKIKNVREWLKYASTDHFHHYLVEIGLGRIGSTVLIYFTTISLGLSAIIVSRSGTLTALASILQGFIIFGIIGVLIVLGARKGRAGH